MSPAATPNHSDTGAGFVRAVAAMGGVASIALTYYAGRKNPSILLIALFCGWALAPFAAAFWLAFRVRASVIAGLAIADVAIYAAEAFGALPAKAGFIFLIVPLLSWGPLAIALLLGRRRLS